MKYTIVVLFCLISINSQSQDDSFDLSQYREKAFKDVYFTMSELEADSVLGKMTNDDRTMRFGDGVYFSLWNPSISTKYGLYEIPFSAPFEMTKESTVRFAKKVESFLKLKGYSNLITINYSNDSFFNNMEDELGYYIFKYFWDEEVKNDAAKMIYMIAYKDQQPNSYDVYLCIQSFMISSFIEFDEKDKEEDKILKNLGF